MVQGCLGVAKASFLFLLQSFDDFCKFHLELRGLAFEVLQASGDLTQAGCCFEFSHTIPPSIAKGVSERLKAPPRRGRGLDSSAEGLCQAFAGLV